MCCMKYFTNSFLYYQQGHKSLTLNHGNQGVVDFVRAIWLNKMCLAYDALKKWAQIL